MPNIVLKNRDGVPVEHPTDRVRLMMSDGNQQEFVNADSIAVPVPVNVELDFSNGDMEVVPENGKVFSKVIVTQPETLVPENIVKDVEIGGVVGTFAGGGAVYAHGSFAATGTSATITHGLGCVPDLVVVSKTSNVSGAKDRELYSAMGISERFASLIAVTSYKQRCWIYKNNVTNKAMPSYSSYPISQAGDEPISSATETSFVVGGSSFLLVSGHKYEWYAIGGLT
jgi:hypothetical protein